MDNKINNFILIGPSARMSYINKQINIYIGISRGCVYNGYSATMMSISIFIMLWLILHYQL